MRVRALCVHSFLYLIINVILAETLPEHIIPL